jgi:hypothetical protein
MLSFLLEWGLPYMVASVLTTMLTVDVFYHRIVRKPLKFHAKRFGMNTLLLCALSAPFFPWFVIVLGALSKYLGVIASSSITLVSWSALVAVIGFKLKHEITRYWI